MAGLASRRSSPGSCVRPAGFWVNDRSGALASRYGKRRAIVEWEARAHQGTPRQRVSDLHGRAPMMAWGDGVRQDGSREAEAACGLFRVQAHRLGLAERIAMRLTFASIFCITQPFEDARARLLCKSLDKCSAPRRRGGNPHVQFDERGWETGRCHMAQATAPILDSTTGMTRSVPLRPFSG